MNQDTSNPVNLARFITLHEAEQLRKEQRRNIVLYNAASRKGLSFLNPFHYSADYHIPVPGMQNTLSHSVEAIWQGLKLIEGKTDFAMFEREPEKRPSQKERKSNPNYVYEDSLFLYQERVFDLVTARHCIYVPAYRFLFKHYVPTFFKECVRRQLENGREVYFYDIDENGDLNNKHSSFAHSSLLVELINNYVKNSVSISIGKVKETIPYEEVLTALEPSEQPQQSSNRFQMEAAYTTYVSRKVDDHLRYEGFKYVDTVHISQEKHHIRETRIKYATDANEVTVVKSYYFRNTFSELQASFFVIECGTDNSYKPKIEQWKRVIEGIHSII